MTFNAIAIRFYGKRSMYPIRNTFEMEFPEISLAFGHRRVEKNLEERRDGTRKENKLYTNLWIQRFVPVNLIID